MKNAIYALVLAVAPALAFAQPAPAPALRLVAGDLVAAVPANGDACPAFASFRLDDPEFRPGSRFVWVTTDRAWQRDGSLCLATLTGAQMGILRSGAALKVSAAVAGRNDAPRSDAVPVRFACSGEACTFADPSAKVSGNPLSGFADKVSGWFKTMPQQDPAKTAQGCETATDCPITTPGTVGEDIKRSR